MNYNILFLITLVLLFLVYTPGVLTFSFSRLTTVLQVTFIPFTQWRSNPKDLKGNNWFGTFRVLGGKALKYNQDASKIEDAYDSIAYFLRICGFEFEYVKLLEKRKEDEV